METISGTFLSKYRIIGKKGEGTFSEVIKCQSLADGVLCASKRMKGKFSSLEQINNLREVQALRRLHTHPNIIKLMDVIFDPSGKTLDLVFELMDMNIYERIRGRHHHLPESLVKSYMYQLVKALDHMHRNGIFHRDVKPENILIKDELLKLADLGSCRGIYSKQPFTEYISTRWYRAPECLLTDGFYTFKMDVWSVGCVMFEVISLYPLFPGSNELDQINKIHDIMGTPSPALLAKIRRNAPMKYSFPTKQGTGIARLLPHASADCLDLLTGMLQYDPDLRLSARQALRHPYFKELRDADKRRAKMADGAAMASPEPAGVPSLPETVKSPVLPHLATATRDVEDASSQSTVEGKHARRAHRASKAGVVGLPPIMLKAPGGKAAQAFVPGREADLPSVLPQINPRIVHRS